MCFVRRQSKLKPNKISGGTPGVGIRGMGERLRQLGGALQINSNGSGTIVEARLVSGRESFHGGQTFRVSSSPAFALMAHESREHSPMPWVRAIRSPRHRAASELLPHLIKAVNRLFS